MPRASNGTYTLPAGNPVVTGTTISSVWGNTTMSDIATALTGSLARNGDGAMTASLKLFDGLVGAPGLSWSTEPTSGLYRNAAGDFRYSISANDVLTLAATGVGIPDGVPATPGLRFLLDPNSGLYRQGADNIGLVVGGGAILDLTAARVLNTALYWAAAGGVAGPAYSFTNDSNTGMYNGGADNLRLVTGGVLALEIGSAQRLWAVDGSAAAPAYSFSADTDVGMYRVSANIIGFAVGGVNVARFAGNSSGEIQVGDGNVGLPAYTFINDTDTGIYRIGSDNFGLSAGGVIQFEVNAGSALVLRSRALHGFQDGSVAIPGMCFVNDIDTGIYRIAADDMRLAAGGVSALGIQPAAIVASVAILANNGTVGAPEYSFASDSNTGVYRIGADQMGISCGGVLQAQFFASLGVLQVNDGSVAGPAYSFISDINTGLAWIGSDNACLVAGGNKYVEWSNGTNSLVLGLNSSTSITINNVSAAVANAGAAGAPPAQVVGYLTVTINGTARKIPYYAT